MPTFDASSASSAVNGSAGDETVSHTIGSGSNRLLLVLVSIESSALSSSGVTYNSVAMTSIGTGVDLGGNQVEGYYMLEADLPSTGSYNIVSSISGSYIDGGHTVSAISVSGAKQSAPSYETASASTTTIVSDTITVAETGDILFKGSNSNANNRTATHGAGTWTEVYDVDAGGSVDTSQNSAYIVTTGSGSTTASTTYSNTVGRAVQMVMAIESGGVSGRLVNGGLVNSGLIR